MRKRCTLVGMPGSGKSTVGRQLARRLGVPFIDLDQRLEEVLGSSIRQYFEEQGEESFRQKEAQLARQEAELVAGAKLPPVRKGAQGDVFILAGDAFSSGQAQLTASATARAITWAASMPTGWRWVGWADFAASSHTRSRSW